MSKEQRAYFGNFDGLRFIAATLVICAHYVTYFSEVDPTMGWWQRVIFTLDGSGAEAAVGFFFVLSGFLITYLTLRDNDATNAVSIGKFYVRRVLRIWPLYYVCMIAGFLLYPALSQIQDYKEIAHWKLYALFLANFDQIYFGNSNFLLGVFWSIAIEEQFYLVWPWIVFAFRNRLLTTCLVTLAISIIFQSITHLPSHTISSFHDLTIGAALAVVCFHKREVVGNWIRRARPVAIALFYLFGLMIIVGRYQITNHFPGYEYMARTVNAAIYSIIILDQGFNVHSPVQIGRVPMISELGKVSYGLYLLHPLCILVVHRLLYHSIPTWCVLPAVLSLSIGLSLISFYGYERFFLKLKSRYY